MAFSTGYHLSGVSCLCSVPNANTKLSQLENILRVTYITAADKTQQWRINAKDISSSTPGASRPRQALYLNGHSPSVPGDFSMEYDQKIEKMSYLLKLKGEDKPIEGLMIVDAIQRLGVNHLFEEEIETILRKNYSSSTAAIRGFHTLHDVSLFFRLMRQHGHYVSSGVFNQFKGEDGRFRRELRHDIKGLIELYEAAQLSFEGETTLDEAENFSRQSLNECMANMDDYSRRIVGNKLRHPFHKSIRRFSGRNLHDDRGSMYAWGKTLRELAAMDLQMRKSIYQKELFQVSEWWNELRLAENLSLARNELVKWYTWSMIVFIDDISLSEHRIELTKSISFIYLIDDIFDVYGTLEELVTFVQAINKWDYAATATLPDYMKMCYKALLDTTNETCCKTYEKYGYNPIDTLKTMWASLCNAFLMEAKWLASGNLPNSSEYLENGKVSTGVHVMIVHLFFLLGLGGGYRGSVQLDKISELTSSVATILRLWDDLGNAKDEHQVGKDGSYIECYMKEHKNLSVAQAQRHANELIAREWKRLNKECFNLNRVSASSLKRAALNAARIISHVYSDDDNQRLPILEEYVKFILFD